MFFQPTADGFTDERNHFRNISAGPIGPSRKPISQQEYLDKVEEAVLESDGLETYIEILKKNGLQMDENQVSDSVTPIVKLTPFSLITIT